MLHKKAFKAINCDNTVLTHWLGHYHVLVLYTYSLQVLLEYDSNFAQLSSFGINKHVY